MAAATTSERASSKPHGEILNETSRIEEAASYSSKGHFKAAEMWGLCHIVLGLLIVVLAAFAGAKAFAKIDADGTLVGFISIGVAVLTGVTTFLNPNKKKSDHLSAGNKYAALVSRVRIFRTIDCWGDSSDQALSAKLIRHTDELATLNQASPQISSLAYRLAKAGIGRGETAYAVDAKPKDDNRP